MKRKKDNLPDIMISKVNFYGEQLDFFFLVASVNKAETSEKPSSRRGKKRSAVSLKPDKL